MSIYFSELLPPAPIKKVPKSKSSDKDEGIKTPNIGANHRFAQTGENVNLPTAIELRKINEEIGLLGHEFVDELNTFNETLLTRELFQSYLQGYIKSTDSYSKLLEAVRPFLAHRKKLYGDLMDKDMVSIINGWYKLLNISTDSANGAPTRLLSERLGKQVNPLRPKGGAKNIDPTTIFRWIQLNKKPSSISTLIWLDGLVKEAAKK